uniref:Putative secreted protein n=1 Tax=Anopheles darlingi TaxID=43151 RepID=A0A2M4D001_ANODA
MRNVCLFVCFWVSLPWECYLFAGGKQKPRQPLQVYNTLNALLSGEWRRRSSAECRCGLPYAPVNPRPC